MGSWLAPPTLLHLRTPTASSPHRTRRLLSMLAAAYRAETATAETATGAAPAAAAAAAAGAASYSNRPPQPSSPLLPCLRGHRTAHSAPPTLAQIRERTANEHHQRHHAFGQPRQRQRLLLLLRLLPLRRRRRRAASYSNRPPQPLVSAAALLARAPDGAQCAADARANTRAHRQRTPPTPPRRRQAPTLASARSVVVSGYSQALPVLPLPSKTPQWRANPNLQ